MAFDPKEHLIDLKGKPYLPVQYRVQWLRDEHPDAEISVTLQAHLPEMGFALFHATVQIPGAGSATGHGSETSNDFGDYIEKAETKAIGRALAFLGYGTQFCAEELGEGEKRGEPAVVDSPPMAPRVGRTRAAPQGGITPVQREKLRDLKEARPQLGEFYFDRLGNADPHQMNTTESKAQEIIDVIHERLRRDRAKLEEAEPDEVPVE